MRIQYMSDLHMELYDNSRYIKAAIEREESELASIPEREQARPKVKAKEFDANGDALVLAGDTFYLRDIIAPQKKFWNWASKNFRQVLMVPGNHEFYGNGDVTERGDSWQWQFRENVGYYYNKVVRIDDTDFILTTLWSKIPEMDMFYVLRGMNDFRQIMYDEILETGRQREYCQTYRCGYSPSAFIGSSGCTTHGLCLERSICNGTWQLHC